MSNRVLRWVVNAILLPLDYFVSGWFWQHPGMTISSRCGMAMLSDDPSWKNRALKALGRWLNTIDPGHCFGAIAGDIERTERTLRRLQLWRAKLRGPLA